MCRVEAGSDLLHGKWSTACTCVCVPAAVTADVDLLQRHDVGVDRLQRRHHRGQLVAALNVPLRGCISPAVSGCSGALFSSAKAGRSQRGRLMRATPLHDGSWMCQIRLTVSSRLSAIRLQTHRDYPQAPPLGRICGGGACLPAAVQPQHLSRPRQAWGERFQLLR